MREMKRNETKRTAIRLRIKRNRDILRPHEMMHPQVKPEHNVRAHGALAIKELAKILLGLGRQIDVLERVCRTSLSCWTERARCDFANEEFLSGKGEFMVDRWMLERPGTMR